MQKHVRYLAPAAVVLALALAGCQTPSKTESASTDTMAATGAPGAAQPGAAGTAGGQAGQATSTGVEFYIAQTEAGPGLMELPLKDGSLYVQRTPALTRDDLAEAAAMVDKAGQNFVGLRFNEAGARKLTEVSTANVGNRLVLVIDRELIAAPRIAEPLDRGVLAFATPNAQAAADIAAAIRGDDPSAGTPAPAGNAAPPAAPAPSVPAEQGSGAR